MSFILRLFNSFNGFQLLMINCLVFKLDPCKLGPKVESRCHQVPYVTCNPTEQNPLFLLNTSFNKKK